MDYQSYQNTKHWKRVRRRALRRARQHCQLCGCKERLSVHHNSYERLGKEKRSDVVVLCRECHRLFHGIMQKPKGAIPPIADLENLKKVLHM